MVISALKYSQERNMLQRKLIGRPLVSTTGSALSRLMVTKASNRAAVHGAKLPKGDVVEKDEMEKEIMQKEKKREEIEKSVDSSTSSTSNAPPSYDK